MEENQKHEEKGGKESRKRVEISEDERKKERRE